MESSLAATDAAVARLLEREVDRQNTTLTLIASENHSSRAVREACSSVLTDKYGRRLPRRALLRRLRSR